MICAIGLRCPPFGLRLNPRNGKKKSTFGMFFLECPGYFFYFYFFIIFIIIFLFVVFSFFCEKATSVAIGKFFLLCIPGFFGGWNPGKTFFIRLPGFSAFRWFVKRTPHLLNCFFLHRSVGAGTRSLNFRKIPMNYRSSKTLIMCRDKTLIKLW